MTVHGDATVFPKDVPSQPTPENVAGLVKRDFSLSYLITLKDRRPEAPLFGRSWDFRKVEVGHEEKFRLLYDRQQGKWFPVSGTYGGEHPACRIEAEGGQFYGVYSMRENSILYIVENEDWVVLTCRSVE